MTARTMSHPRSGDAGRESPLDDAGVAELTELMGESREALQELVFVFLDEAEACVKELRVAASERDCASLARAAHSLKGSSANMAARRLPALCADLESLAQRGELGRAGDVVDEVEAELEDVKAALVAELGPVSR